MRYDFAPNARLFADKHGLRNLRGLIPKIFDQLRDCPLLHKLLEYWIACVQGMAHFVQREMFRLRKFRVTYTGQRTRLVQAILGSRPMQAGVRIPCANAM